MKNILLVLIGLVVAHTLNAQLRLNEVMAHNEGVLMDVGDSFDDWVEIYNAGDSAVSLKGYSLTDDRDRLRKFTFRTRANQPLIVPAHGFLLVWCDEDQLEGPTHTNFRLKAAGEWIGLSNAQGRLIDSVSFGKQSADVSYGRLADGTGDWSLLKKPTPCNSNANAGGSMATEAGLLERDSPGIVMLSHCHFARLSQNQSRLRAKRSNFNNFHS